MNDSAIDLDFHDYLRDSIAEHGPSYAHTLAMMCARLSAEIWHQLGAPYRRTGRRNHYGWWDR